MVEIRILKQNDQLALEAFLGPRIETSMFLLSNARRSGLVDQGKMFQGTYAAAFDRESIIGVVAHFWNDGLLPQAPLQYLDALWRAAVVASGRPIGGVVGPKTQAEAIATALGIGPDDLKLNSVETLYQLKLSDLIEPEALRAGRVCGRQGVVEDEDLLTDWRVAYSIETLGDTEGPELRKGSRDSMRHYIEAGHAWVLEEQGTPVACTFFNATLTEAVQVGGVFTPPEFRSRGHGRSVVTVSLKDAYVKGVETAILFTDEQNMPARKAYEALGFRSIGDYRLLVLRKPLDYSI